jgi:hypothetical protein
MQQEKHNIVKRGTSCILLNLWVRSETYRSETCAGLSHNYRFLRLCQNIKGQLVLEPYYG